MLETESCLATAEQRWEEATRRHPDLADAIELQRRLVRRTLALWQLVAETTPYHHRLDREAAAAKLRAGRPALIGETISVDNGRVSPFVTGFCDDLASGANGDAAARLRATLARPELDVGALVAASLTRHQDAIRATAHRVGVSPDLLWLVAELAAAPLANRLQAELLPEPTTSGAPALDWSNGYCPGCGSRPALAERVGEARPLRWLRCSFCGCGWPSPAGRCAYCATTGASLVTAGLEPVGDRYAVEMCAECGAYLKLVAVETATPFPLLAVEDLVSTALDLGAHEKGYARPPMPEFPGSQAAPCPPPPDVGNGRSL